MDDVTANPASPGDARGAEARFHTAARADPPPLPERPAGRPPALRHAHAETLQAPAGVFLAARAGDPAAASDDTCDDARPEGRTRTHHRPRGRRAAAGVSRYQTARISPSPCRGKPRAAAVVVAARAGGFTAASVGTNDDECPEGLHPRHRRGRSAADAGSHRRQIVRPLPCLRHVMPRAAGVIVAALAGDFPATSDDTGGDERPEDRHPHHRRGRADAGAGSHRRQIVRRLPCPRQVKPRAASVIVAALVGDIPATSDHTGDDEGPEGLHPTIAGADLTPTPDRTAGRSFAPFPVFAR
ncbi:hypothetical protein LNKW23_05250 [Paralimibaculum aggregatum]|uniref:Uncharacterized protein n=1 Tax=Paralimibaculum aggregatum TaxID=3036245 RepID=A0ABQ6LEB6_9RHOB|nr:hypothetical protein [Limibaculum sp. NKW23]GMG81312.1 hypothetical protein LNKW23_05250 [Limibaculum sp. NKW23]